MDLNEDLELKKKTLSPFKGERVKYSLLVK